MLDVLSSGRGVRLRLVIEGEGQAPGTCVCDDLSTTTHPLQYRGFELDMQETIATEVRVSSSCFFLREKECTWDLLLKEEGGCLRVVLRAQVCLIDWKGRAPVDQGAPKGEWHFSAQYPDGVVQVVSTRGVVVSITGCRLESRLSRIFFYR